MLRARGVTRKFGGLVAVNSVDFEIPRGSISAIIGPNGAGKTTFFNVIAGIVGVVNAAKITIVTPDQFRFAVSISALAAVVLGGMGNTIGVATGAFIIYLFQSILLKQLNTLVENFNIPILNQIDFLEFQYVLYGIVLVLMMLKRPQGIFPARRRMREFAPLKIGKGGLK